MTAARSVRANNPPAFAGGEAAIIMIDMALTFVACAKFVPHDDGLVTQNGKEVLETPCSLS